MSDRPVMLVTGGARGIGAAIARAAAPLYDLVVNHHSSGVAAAALAEELRSSGAAVLTVQADVGSEAEVVRMFHEIDASFGRIDVLVNNAGIAGGHGSIATVDEAMLTRLWAVNVTGPFLCSREAAARMRTDQGGRGGCIVNISSKAALIGGADEWVHYAASKGAIETLTTGLARELAPYGVRVNAVRPGLIESDFHLHAPPGRVERMAPVIPMRRSGTPDEVAPAVLFLAGPDAGYITGAFLDVTGGR